MLPYTPLHHLLMDEVRRPVVCTSGNRAEEPMAIRTEDALRRLGDIADLVLTHDRRIVRPVDDSVAREDDGQLQVLRRAADSRRCRFRSADPCRGFSPSVDT